MTKQTKQLTYFVVACIAICLMASTAQAWMDPLINFESVDDWNQAMDDGTVGAMMAENWLDYENQWENALREGEGLPGSKYSEPFLFTHKDDLAMVWDADGSSPDNSYSAAWEVIYAVDPHLGGGLAPKYTSNLVGGSNVNQ